MPTPFESPGLLEEPESWQAWIRRILFFGGDPAAVAFADGAKILIQGIAFYIAPDDPASLFAGSPSTTHADDRMNLVVAETLVVLPIFLRRHPGVHRVVAGRTLKVRLITSYNDEWSQFQRQKQLTEDHVAAALRDAKSNG